VSHVFFNPSQTVFKLKTLILGAWILLLLNSLSRMSADVTAEINGIKPEKNWAQ